MEFTEVVKIKNRMVGVTKYGICHIECRDCLLSAKHNGMDCNCTALRVLCPEKYEEILLNWAKEHPIKTNKDVLLEMFPDVNIDNRGIPLVSPCHCGLTKDCIENHYCPDCKKEFWNAEYKKDN